jgi:5-methylcytosine-specific restriction endonuclease McrA
MEEIIKRLIRQKKINTKKRYQRVLTTVDLFPVSGRKCACRCGRQRRWATKSCQRRALNIYWVVKGNTTEIRKQLFQEQKGKCQVCREYNRKWQADHINPVHQGGGGCTLDNFQTICPECHKIKTKEQSRLIKKLPTRRSKKKSKRVNGKQKRINKK